MDNQYAVNEWVHHSSSQNPSKNPAYVNMQRHEHRELKGLPFLPMTSELDAHPTSFWLTVHTNFMFLKHTKQGKWDGSTW